MCYPLHLSTILPNIICFACGSRLLLLLLLVRAVVVIRVEAFILFLYVGGILCAGTYHEAYDERLVGGIIV